MYVLLKWSSPLPGSVAPPLIQVRCPHLITLHVAQGHVPCLAQGKSMPQSEGCPIMHRKSYPFLDSASEHDRLAEATGICSQGSTRGRRFVRISC